MVYYGALSKGCQRCRQRKIKCDQRKPGCLKCQIFGAQCPGYRNLGDVLFRDESERIIRKVRQAEQPPSTPAHPAHHLIHNTPSGESNALVPFVCPVNIPYPLSQSTNELGTNFFFKKYILNEPPFTSDYHDWLAQSCLDAGSSHVLRVAIESVGMAGISNVFYAPHIASKSQKRYCEGLAAMKQALSDPVQATADTTLMAVILFGLFESVNFETWDRSHHWEAHIKGATTLLELRGHEQFNRDLGGQLFLQTRSHILSLCMQNHISVPPSLVKTGYDFQNSAIRERWRHRNLASPGSMSEISFRLVNLRAAFKKDKSIDPEVIRKMALDLDADLEAWREVTSPAWGYNVIDAPKAVVSTCFDGKVHSYPSLWIAEAWNGWRAMRILINQMLLQNEDRRSVPNTMQKTASLSVISQFSREICVSTFSFIGTPCILSLIHPMYLVALEESNSYHIRSFALEQLRTIDNTMGIRKAGLLADHVLKQLDSPSQDLLSTSSDFVAPFFPFR